MNKLLYLGASLATLLGLGCGSAQAALPLGTVTITSGDCATGRCTVTATCSGINAKQADLRIKTPSSTAPRNTVVFFTGGSGNGFWGDASSYASTTIDTLVAEGFRTIEVAWVNGNWAYGSTTGPATTACRPASVIDFLYKHYDIAASGGFLHATGNSAGSAQISFSLSHYGLENIISTAVVTGGPPYARLDLGCFNPLSDPIAFHTDARAVIDQTFGFGKNGPCQTQNSAYADLYHAGSVVSDGHDYNYPNTIMHFIFGTADTTNSDEEGLEYFQRLLSEKTPYLAVQYIEGMPHELPKTQDGTAAVLNALRMHKK